MLAGEPLGATMTRALDASAIVFVASSVGRDRGPNPNGGGGGRGGGSGGGGGGDGGDGGGGGGQVCLNWKTPPIARCARTRPSAPSAMPALSVARRGTPRTTAVSARVRPMARTLLHSARSPLLRRCWLCLVAPRSIRRSAADVCVFRSAGAPQIACVLCCPLRALTGVVEC